MTQPAATQADLLDLWRRLFPPSYTQGIETEDDGAGFVPFQAFAAMLARVAQAQTTNTQAYYLMPSSLAVAPWASGAAYATGSVQIARLPPAWAALLVPAGTRVVARLQTIDGIWVDGPEFQTTEDLSIPAGDLGPWTVPIRSTRVGDQGNVPPTRIKAFSTLGTATVTGTATAPDTLTDNGQPDRFTLEMVGRYLRITAGADAGATPRRITSASYNPATGVSVVVDGPALVGGAFTAEIEEWSELGLTVTQPLATTGGVHGWLDAIGQERGIYRQSNEPDESLRARIDQLADVVSPAAVVRLCDRLLTPVGIPWRLIEAGAPVTLTAFQWEPSDVGTGASVLRTIDFSTRTRTFAIALGLTGAGETGTYLDTILGATDDNALDLGAFCDGAPAEWLATISALRVALDSIKAGGFAALILVDPAYF